MTIFGPLKGGTQIKRFINKHLLLFIMSYRKRKGPDFSGVRKEAQNWVKGMGDQVI